MAVLLVLPTSMADMMLKPSLNTSPTALMCLENIVESDITYNKLGILYISILVLVILVLVILVLVILVLVILVSVIFVNTS